ncbi:hypothetical protein [Streptomyces sp. NPDC047130]|uniref:hypothetical protein n=1 Tax=Streptomyces sp. NPDC047130 TaxID=3155261 RepID=UPI0033F3AE3F
METSELDHLREIERLAGQVVEAAVAEGRLDFDDGAGAGEGAGEGGGGGGGGGGTALGRSLRRPARARRHHHFEGDGCLEEDRPLVRLVGACVLRPAVMPAGVDEPYDEVCARLGAEPRPEGWALWNTWGDEGVKVTLVVSAVATTEGLIANWSRGREVDPVAPLPSQVALVRRGWIGPVAFSPRAVRQLGVGGRPLPQAPGD